jgi:ArsR family transcriptional regulator
MSAIHDELNQLHASVCKGLADPKRLLIINALRDGERTVTELVEELAVPQANVSQHLAVLRDKGLVHARKEGQFAYYSVTTPKIIEAMDLLREVMAEQVMEPVGR